MAVKHRDQETVNKLWIAVTVLVGVLLGVLSTYINLQPKVDRLQQQGAQFQSVIQEQNRQIAAMRSNQSQSFNGPIAAQNANQSAAAIQQIPNVSGAEVFSSAPPVYALSNVNRPEQSQASPPPLPPESQQNIIKQREASPVVQPAANSLPQNTRTTASSKETSDQVTPPATPTSLAPPATPRESQKQNTNTIAKPAPVKDTKPPAKAQPVAAKELAKGTEAPAKERPDGLHPEARAALEGRESLPERDKTPTPQSDGPSVVAVPGKAVVKATLGQANIAGMDSVSVTFKTGLRVQVGSQFPSGERLLSVSPGSKKIETDRRIILLQLEETAN